MPAAVPIDPASSPQWALTGRIVTMDAGSTVHSHGTVWVSDAEIAAVTDDNGTPAGFEGITPLDSGGTIFPGLIDLHNHVAYDALPLWQVPARYTNRDTWGNTADYHRLVTAPMKTLGEATELLPALVRYVEAKALVGGVTTTQGIALFSAPGLRRYYRGIVRNVEETNDRSNFPEAGSRIADVDAKDPQAFLKELKAKKCFLLHLSEGTDAAARRHFEALKLPSGQWAIDASLAGIHCVALQAGDFALMASKGASMVWSPFSNLLLYGQTADVAAARSAGEKDGRLKIALGSDWSPSGSKSLLGELKVARVYSQNGGQVFSDEDLVQLATANAAHILGWQDRVGTIETGKRADLLVVAGQQDPAYGALFAGDERHVQLVVINGTPRYGSLALMAADGAHLERLKVGGEDRVLYLEQATEDPQVSAISYAQAQAKLKDALANIVDVRRAQEAEADAQGRSNAVESLGAAPDLREGHPRLALDEFEHTDFTQRPHLRLDGTATGPTDKPTAQAASAPISSLLSPTTLDALTVADDQTFLDRVAAEANLPGWLAPGLRALYAT